VNSGSTKRDHQEKHRWDVAHAYRACSGVQPFISADLTKKFTEFQSNQLITSMATEGLTCWRWSLFYGVNILTEKLPPVCLVTGRFHLNTFRLIKEYISSLT